MLAREKSYRCNLTILPGQNTMTCITIRLCICIIYSPVIHCVCAGTMRCITLRHNTHTCHFLFLPPPSASTLFSNVNFIMGEGFAHAPISEPPMAGALNYFIVNTSAFIRYYITHFSTLFSNQQNTRFQSNNLPSLVSGNTGNKYVLGGMTSHLTTPINDASKSSSTVGLRKCLNPQDVYLMH